MKELSVKMSANETLVQPADPDNNEAFFWCEIPIPNYLMAIAVGHLEYRSLGRNVGIITEPEQMDKCFNELTDMQVWLDTIENYLTPYIWGNYTILILPPSFPMGGMENPLLTFASPTIIVGDKSQVYVATHEMAHSWTGNTVTCQNWEDFWLNEGFTVFVERHVSGILYGNDFAKVEAQLGNTSLWNAMVDYGLETSYSSIHPVLKGDNPDHSFSEVPYEKGFQLLWYMQDFLGNATMQEFLQYYINENFEKSITVLDLQRTWNNWVQDNAAKENVNHVLAKIEWSTW
jgi:leukotriene-A4 hydrolase